MSAFRARTDKAMKRTVLQTALALSTCLAVLSAPLGVVAQAPPGQQSQPEAAAPEYYPEHFMSEEHRREIYDENRKRPGKALLYSLLLPGLGNIYAEQYLLAGVNFVLMAFAITFVGYGLANDQTGVVAVGGVTAGLAYGVGTTTSLLGVSRHNLKLRQGLKIADREVREVWAPAVVMRF